MTDRIQRRWAAPCVDRIEGVRDLHDRIRVVPSEGGRPLYGWADRPA